jgi:hypothetical protein
MNAIIRPGVAHAGTLLASVVLMAGSPEAAFAEVAAIEMDAATRRTTELLFIMTSELLAVSGLSAEESAACFPTD